MWAGWNSLLKNGNETMQKISYLSQINQSPTSYAVVQETLKRSLKILEETEKSSISVTMDLAIAKIALQIQYQEMPKFDKIFINLGAFHIEMAFFKAIGKYIEESGGPYVLIEADVLAAGSLKGFIQGKHYNRCKRLHPLLAAAFEILHIEMFVKQYEIDPFIIMTISKELEKIQEEKYLNTDYLSRELNEFIAAYETFVKGTVNGNHGLTAKYWIKYVDMIHLYHEFSRSIRTGDHDLYVYCLPKISKYFFSFNQPNYARWMTRYHDNLLRLNETHPEVEEEYKNGGISIKRTKKSFAKTAVDLTLEQTINANAASQKNGISAFTNSISARQRWAQSHSISVTLLSHLLDGLGLSSKEDVSSDLKLARIKKNSSDVGLIKETIKNTMNPFSEDEKDKSLLYNIASGKAAAASTAEFLMNVDAIGERRQNTFIDECCERPTRFEEKITREKLATFASEGATTKKKCGNKEVQLKMERNLFVKILHIALERKVDMGELLKYPLTPLPLSLSHLDGTMRSTSKCRLVNEIKKNVTSIPPNHIDTVIVDGFFMMHAILEAPSTFGRLGSLILKKLCKFGASRIDLVFDRFFSPSIKDQERISRANGAATRFPYSITGSQMKVPSNFKTALRNSCFKESLIKFLVNYWNNDEHAETLGDKVVYVTKDEFCFSFRSLQGKTMMMQEDHLTNQFEEADHRMFHHVKSIPPPANVVIRARDSDLLIIALGIFDKLQGLNLWLEVGQFTNNTLEYISVNQLYDTLGESVCSALPAFHIFTGSDYTAAFSRRGKVAPLKKLIKNEEFLNAFSSLGSSEAVLCTTIKTIEKFVCHMYGKPKLTSVDEARLEYFSTKYKTKPGKPLKFSELKNMDSSSWPPCYAELYQKILRTNLAANILKSSHMQSHSFFPPLLNGWFRGGEYFYPKWFEGEMAPPSLDTFTTPFEVESDDSDDDDDNPESGHCSSDSGSEDEQ